MGGGAAEIADRDRAVGEYLSIYGDGLADVGCLTELFRNASNGLNRDSGYVRANFGSIFFNMPF